MPKPRRASVLVPEDIGGQGLDRLGRVAEVAVDPALWRDPERLRRAVREVDVLVVRNQTDVDRSLLQEAQKLRLVGRVGVGLDNIDLGACEARGIEVVHAGGLNAVSVAEMAMLLILALTRRFRVAYTAATNGTWDRLAAMGTELDGRTLGLIGFGATGREVAVRARAFGMRILASDPLVADGGELAEMVGVDELLPLSDIVSLHVPLTAATRHLLDEEALMRMRRGAYLVNTARGGVVDERALMQVLEQGHLGGAALDVREVEPPAPDDPLAQCDNVLLTPHIAGLTAESHERVLDHVCRVVSDRLMGAGAESTGAREAR